MEGLSISVALAVSHAIHLTLRSWDF